jgi:NADH-quinone oxidoreductase subunit I
VVSPIQHYHFTERGQNILTKEKLLAIGDLMEEQIAAARVADEPYR